MRGDKKVRRGSRTDPGIPDGKLAMPVPHFYHGQSKTHQHIFVLSNGLSASVGIISRRFSRMAVSASTGMTSDGLLTVVRG